jgi:hypothetical protein
MPKHGLQTLAKYAFRPFEIGQCGPELRKMGRQLFDYAANPTREKERLVANAIRKSPTLYKKLTEIAASNRIRNPLDARVAEAYWKGNKLLDKTAFLPEGSLPVHHNTIVLTGGKGTGKINACRIAAAEIKAVKGSYAVAEVRKIRKEAGKYVLGGSERAVIRLSKFGKTLVPNLKPGDSVAVHHGFAVEKMSKAEARRLNELTKQIISGVNRLGTSGGSKTR